MTPAPLDDGGPAFPVLTRGSTDDRGKWIPDQTDGMSLRDWFAGHALAGILPVALQLGISRQDIPAFCYRMADDMIERRKINGPG